MNINIVDTAVGNLNTEPQWFKWLKGVIKMNTINKKTNQPNKKVVQLKKLFQSIVNSIVNLTGARTPKDSILKTAPYYNRYARRIGGCTPDGLDNLLEMAVNELLWMRDEVNIKNPQDRQNLLCAAMIMLCSLLETTLSRTSGDFYRRNFGQSFLCSLNRMGLFNDNFDNFINSSRLRTRFENYAPKKKYPMVKGNLVGPKELRQLSVGEGLKLPLINVDYAKPGNQ